MGKLWLNNELVDRLAMLQQTEATHPGINQVAIEKDWWVTVTQGGAGFGVLRRSKRQADYLREYFMSMWRYLSNHKAKQ